jgi:hypothetical protein
MGQRGRQKPAVSARGLLADSAGVDQDDIKKRVILFSLQRRPKPGKPSPDDNKIGLSSLATGLGLLGPVCAI